MFCIISFYFYQSELGFGICFFNCQCCKRGQLSRNFIKRDLGSSNFSSITTVTPLFSFFEKKQKQSLICLKSCETNNFLAVLEFVHFASSIKTKNSWKLTFAVEPMLNILFKYSFCDFVKIPQKFLPFPC